MEYEFLKIIYIKHKKKYKELLVPWYCSNIEDIVDCEPLIEKGKISKDRVKITHKIKGNLILSIKYNELKELLKNKNYKKIYGFNQT